MTRQQGPPTALGDLRVLDLAGPIGWYGTRLLADLGADVLRIVPPGADPALPPFDRAGTSLTNQWFNAGKRRVALDLGEPAGHEAFRTLARQADVVFESFAPGWLEARGLGYRQLRELNPRLVMTSVTPFGQRGPYRDWRGTDLVGSAMAGLVSLGGSPTTPPVHLGGDHGYFHTGVAAACGTLVALRGRNQSGHGRHLDISLQDALIFTLENGIGFFDLTGIDRARMGAKFFTGGRLMFPALDGWAVVGLGRNWPNALAFLDEHGVDTARYRQPEWFDQDFRNDHLDELAEVTAGVVAQKTKATLTESGQRHHLTAAPVATTAEVAADLQLAARDYWLDLEQPDGTPVRWQGAPFKLSATPWRVKGTGRKAKGEWGLPRGIGKGEGQSGLDLRLTAGDRDPFGWTGRSDLTDPSDSTAQHASSPFAFRLSPFAGIRILDFTWVVTGPAVTQVFAEHGAEVMKIESRAHLDGLRMMQVPRSPWQNGLNESGIYITINSGKRSVSINLATDEGKAILHDLVRIADIVIDNYGSDPLPKWGLTPARLRELNPDLIVARSSVMGRSGPNQHYVGVGTTIGAAAGLNLFSGFPGDAPAATCTAYPDYSSNTYHLLLAVLAALHYRDRTGVGQTIDLSQHESTTAFNGPAFAEWHLTGRIVAPSANRHPAMAPHGVYPSRGEDRWVAIACEHDDDWPKLATAINRPDLAAEADLATLAGRQARHDELDQAIAAWTRLRTPVEAMTVLQTAGVPAGAVQRMSDVLRNRHLADRAQIRRVRQPELGWTRLDDPGFHLSDEPRRHPRPAPLLAADTVPVLRELLGLSEEAISGLNERGVLR